MIVDYCFRFRFGVSKFGCLNALTRCGGRNFNVTFVPESCPDKTCQQPGTSFHQYGMNVQFVQFPKYKRQIIIALIRNLNVFQVRFRFGCYGCENDCSFFLIFQIEITGNDPFSVNGNPYGRFAAPVTHCQRRIIE